MGGSKPAHTEGTGRNLTSSTPRRKTVSPKLSKSQDGLHTGFGPKFYLCGLKIRKREFKMISGWEYSGTQQNKYQSSSEESNLNPGFKNFYGSCSKE